MRRFIQPAGIGILCLFLSSIAHAAATWVVSSNGDSGANTLREAIADAASGDIITFDFASPTTITLASQLVLSKSLTISGPGAARLSISGNHAVRVFYIVGGINIISGLTITDGYTEDNAEGGGGVFMQDPGRLTLDQCVIQNNSAVNTAASPIQGGGISNQSAILVLNRCQVLNNSVSGTTSSYGGGICSNGNSLAIYNSTLTGNSCAYGSAIYAVYETDTLANVTVQNNSASNLGAIVLNNANASLTNCTITQNTSANNMAGLSTNDTTLSMRNTVIAGNLPAVGTDRDIYFSTTTVFTSLGYNLIGSTGSKTYTWTTGDVVGSESSLQSANLGDLADQGGYVDVCLPNLGSQVIDPANSNGAPWVDARGFLRLNTSDKGAGEYGGTLPIAIAATAVHAAGFIANWNAVPGAQGYALDVATDSAFTNMVSGWGNSLVGNTISWNVAGLASGAIYYYRIRGLNGVYQTYHSNTISTTTLAAAGTSTSTPTFTVTDTQTPHYTSTPSYTVTPSVTFTPSLTMTPTSTISGTITSTCSFSPTYTHSPTITNSPTITPTSSISATFTVSSSATAPGNLNLHGKDFLAFPNPGKTQVTFAFRPENAGHVTLQIYNANGERVARLGVLVNSNNVARVTWECSSIAPGLYFVRAMQGGKEIGKCKIAIARRG